MFENIKKRLLHFETDGDIIPDFINARLIKTAALRKVVHVCFYIQCVAAISAGVAGVILSESAFGRIFSAVAAVCVIAVAFFALGGRTGEKIASCGLDLIYTVIGFCIGEFSMKICAVLLLIATLAALTECFAGYFRLWLLEFPPRTLKSENYTLTEKAVQAAEEELTLPPPEPQKSELMEVAEAFMEIVK